ncbi:MAG: hypothetical protein EAX90_10160 [Candidatus Heimdallarchaeota archaeon]|nr:hypothetical protein [Candidatus Heimdallarchaeota archaeon]
MDEKEEEIKKQNSSIADLFRKGIGLIVAGLFCTILLLVFTSLQQNLLYSGSNSEVIDISILSREIGSNLWSFRVYDLLIIVIVLILTIIGGYYLVNFQPIDQSTKKQERRRMF